MIKLANKHGIEDMYLLDFDYHQLRKDWHHVPRTSRGWAKQICTMRDVKTTIEMPALTRALGSSSNFKNCSTHVTNWLASDFKNAVFTHALHIPVSYSVSHQKIAAFKHALCIAVFSFTPKNSVFTFQKFLQLGVKLQHLKCNANMSYHNSGTIVHN